MGLSKSSATILANNHWSCNDCLSEILPFINSTLDDETAPRGRPRDKFKVRCHSCKGWSYTAIRNVSVCGWCDNTVHSKCYRHDLGCNSCCEDIIPGYNTSCTALNDNYSASSHGAMYNPYDRTHIINSIGEKIDECENSELWNSVSDMLLKCDYKLPLNVKPAKANELKIFSLNVRSLYKSITNFQEEISTYMKYDILSFNETNCVADKLPNGIHDLLLDDFHEPILQNPVRKSGKGGGLAIYINKRVCNPEQIEIFSPNYQANEADSQCGEFQFLKIHKCKGYNQTKIIVNVYRSPSKKVDNFTSLLDRILKGLDRHARKHIVLTGDFNIDLIKYDRDLSSQNLITVLEKYGFLQLVSRPTRITDHSATLIDHVYTNCIENIVSCNVLTVDIPDHLATLTTLSLGSATQQREKVGVNRKKGNVKLRLFNEANNLKFKNLIASETWGEVHSEESAEAKYNKFSEIYTELYDQAYPLKNKGPRRKNERRDPKPWILPWLEDACARRQNLLYLKVKYPTTINISAHYKYDKFCNKHIDKAKKKYYKKFFDDHIDNSKKQWQLINGLLNRGPKRRESIRLKDEHGSLLSNNLGVADRFNDYFSKIASNIKSQISARQTFDPGGFEQFLTEPISTPINLTRVTSGEIHDIISKFKNKATLDTKIGPMKIANSDFRFTQTLADIINKSFNQGIFPSSLKRARVVPIHKGGCKTDVANYRPISLLSSFSKIYEKLMHIRVLNFLDKNGSLFESQYGFRPGMSCEHAILNAQNSLLHSLNNKQIAVLLLIDYSKAFDVIEHPILLKKLEHYGIKGKALEWFESYLSGRHQFVSVNDVDSSLKPIHYGVPQGSTLGPLLFIIYINDLPLISNLAKFILYADDANIIVTGNSEEEVQAKITSISNLLVKWVDSNGLALNLKKPSS